MFRNRSLALYEGISFSSRQLLFEGLSEAVKRLTVCGDFIAEGDFLDPSLRWDDGGVEYRTPVPMDIRGGGLRFASPTLRCCQRR